MYRGYQNQDTYEVARFIRDNGYVLFLIDYFDISTYSDLVVTLAEHDYTETGSGISFTSEVLDTDTLDFYIALIYNGV